MTTDPRGSGTCRRPVAGMLLALALLCGCGGPDGAGKKKTSLSAEDEQQARAMLAGLRLHAKVWQEKVDILKAVQDRPSMAQALAELLKLNDRGAAAAHEMRKVGVLSADAQQFVAEDPVSIQIENLQVATEMEWLRINQLPGGPQFIREHNSAVKKLQAP